MPELPDLTVYLERIEAITRDAPLQRLRIGKPFVLRSVTPAPAAFEGRKLLGTARIGKRLVLEFESEYFAVIHLMILGRLHWKKPDVPIPKGNGLAAFDFEHGTLLLVEHGSKRRAALHLVQGREALQAFERGGLEVMQADEAAFAAALSRENHTLKRALTDPGVLAAIGNAYSDEILHRARLSPFKQTQAIKPEEMQRLYHATRAVLGEWTGRLRAEAANRWPEKVTAFRPEMAVHGRYKLPCPDCGAPVQRIVYADNEAFSLPTIFTRNSYLLQCIIEHTPCNNGYYKAIYSSHQTNWTEHRNGPDLRHRRFCVARPAISGLSAVAQLRDAAC